jgi:hypothetical protein
MALQTQNPYEAQLAVANEASELAHAYGIYAAANELKGLASALQQSSVAWEEAHSRKNVSWSDGLQQGSWD